MSTMTDTRAVTTPAERRRVLFATTVGTTIEWYDFFIYASAAGLVFNTAFFGAAGPEFATLLSFATIGLSFLFRPLGAFVAGHLGDKYGRRVVLVWTLVLMGAATTLIGVLPTYETIGLAAPILLLLLRVLQGISAGGEWGGAVLMAVEHAAPNERGRYGAAPQVGVPLGLLLASGVMAIMTAIAPGDAFMEWGWRVPFLLSFLLILIGHFIRSRVDESPVFLEIAQRAQQTGAPIAQLFRRHGGVVLVAALVFAGGNAAGYMTTGGYIQNYTTNPEGPIGLERGPILWVVAASAFTWLLSTWYSGVLSDRFGRKRVFVFGWIAQLVGVLLLFPLVNIGSIWSVLVALLVLSVGIGAVYGPLSVLFAELFPASIRFSGVSITYAIGAICGGAFAPMIATWLVQTTGSTWSVTAYLAVMTLIGLTATLLLKDRTRIPLGLDHLEEQEANPFVFGGR